MPGKPSLELNCARVAIEITLEPFTGETLAGTFSSIVIFIYTYMYIQIHLLTYIKDNIHLVAIFFFYDV